MLTGVPNALHFSFTCQNCQTPVTALMTAMVMTQVVDATPGDYDLSYTCLVCGVSEHFNTALPSADDVVAGPHGSQVQLIRQIQTIKLLQMLG